MRFNYQNMMCKRQRGLSLIELLISLFLSSLVLVALFSFFANFKANAFLQGSVVDNLHELRIVSDFIRSEVQKAGYKNEEFVGPDPFSVAMPGIFKASRYVSGNETELRIRYQSDGSIRDCVGNPVDVNDVAVVVLRFFKAANAETGTIQCSSGTNQITMLNQVSDFKFSYLRQGGTSYESSEEDDPVVAVKFDITFKRDIFNSNDKLIRNYTQVAALRNVF